MGHGDWPRQAFHPAGQMTYGVVPKYCTPNAHWKSGLRLHEHLPHVRHQKSEIHKLKKKSVIALQILKRWLPSLLDLFYFFLDQLRRTALNYCNNSTSDYRQSSPWLFLKPKLKKQAEKKKKVWSVVIHPLFLPLIQLHRQCETGKSHAKSFEPSQKLVRFHWIFIRPQNDFLIHLERYSPAPHFTATKLKPVLNQY